MSIREENAVRILSTLIVELGYNTAVDVASNALKQDKSIKDILIKEGLMTESRYALLIEPLEN